MSVVVAIVVAVVVALVFFYNMGTFCRGDTVIIGGVYIFSEFNAWVRNKW
jgi:hypothetical protein